MPVFLSAEDLQALLEAIEKHIRRLEKGYGINWKKYPEEIEYKKSKHTSYRKGDLRWIKDVILLAVSTGMRRGELAALTWGMVDLENGFIHLRTGNGFQTKSSDERSIPLLADGLNVIERLAEENPEPSPLEPVLKSSTGGGISPDYTSKLFKLFVRLAGLDERLSFHNLRHTCASWLAMKGVPMGMISKLLGHSSTIITESYYACFTNESIRDALEEALSRETESSEESKAEVRKAA